ncbi:Txe/YoeB family addiction module toxin [Mucilaginibacter flavidus]|uniref:Txe/YoeB family addiction module toxin n=1 Tax=Mucilaginibacter flavidus TaxID=2949309 RepID=UPI002093ECAD|nr:Txe/YoeB family addiction module toxin [Mucilaginibacter flavidus]MCO5945932.1 Txe/YoeB family addiction module toxin [Mucilaginibacter flavidus]
MEVIFTPDALEDLAYWKQKHNDKILARIKDLVKAIQATPFQGIGKPEPLKHNFSGMWSRRINREHRIIYEIVSGKIIIHALKEHY